MDEVATVVVSLEAEVDGLQAVLRAAGLDAAGAAAAAAEESAAATATATETATTEAATEAATTTTTDFSATEHDTFLEL